MSTNNYPIPNYKYKSNTLRNRSYNPKIVNVYDTSTLKIGHYAKKKPIFISIIGMPPHIEAPNYFNLTRGNYIYQDECPDSNVIFFNSNLQKYRIDSLGRKQIIDYISPNSTEKYYSSNTFTKFYNKNRPNQTLNYSLNLNQQGNEYRRNANILSNKNRTITNKNIISHGRMNHSENFSINQNNYPYLYGKNVQKGNLSTSHNIQNKSSNSFDNNTKYYLNPYQDKNMNYNKNQNISLYNKAGQNKYQFQNENQKGNKDNRRMNYSVLEKNDRNIRKDILNRVEVNKNENISGKNKDNLVYDNRRRKPYRSQENKESNNYDLRDAKTTLLNAKENEKLREDKKEKDDENLKNENKALLSNSNENLNSKDTNNKVNELSNSKEKQQLKENRFSRKQNQSQTNQNNLNNFQNYQNGEKFQQLSGSKLKNLNYNDNKNNNINQDDQNVKIFNKTEEKTIVVLPGQTIEPKTINETFQKPIVETIENEDGTTSSIIKQTKITTISENVPIGNEKIKYIEGAPDLPLVKQYITYEYKTVSSPKEGKIMANQILKSQNKVFEEDKLYSEDYQGKNDENKNSNENLGNKNNQMENEGINRNYYAYDEENLKEEINEHNLHEGENEENKPENLNNENIVEIKGSQGNVKGNEGENIMEGGQYEDNKDIQKYEEKSGNKENNLNFQNYGDDNKGIQGDNYLQSSLKGQQLAEGSDQKKLDLSENKNEELHGKNKEGSANKKVGLSGKRDNGEYKEGSANKKVGLSGKSDNGESEDKKINDLKYGKKQEGTNSEFSEKLKLSKKKEGMTSLEKSGKNLEGMESLEKSDKNREGIKSIEKSGKNKDIMKNLEKLNKNKDDKNLKKKSLDNRKKILDNAISSIDNTLKENIKKLSEGPQTKEEKLIIDIIKKGENATPEEKQKRFKFLSDLYEKCSQKGNKDDKEKNIEKLGLYLSSLGESEKKDVLQKLKNIFPENEELYKKLLDLISIKYSFKSKGKKKDKIKSNSLNKNKSNMEHENKNTKKKIGKKKEGVKGNNEFSQSLNLDFKFKNYPEKVVFANENIGGKGELRSSLLKGKFSETIEVKNVNPLKFDGLFLEISKYENIHREKNPFEGPSPFDKFYKVRRTKIRKKIISLANEDNVDEKK